MINFRMKDIIKRMWYVHMQQWPLVCLYTSHAVAMGAVWKLKVDVAQRKAQLT